MLAEKIRRKKAEKDILLMTHIVVGYPTFDASLRVVEQSYGEHPRQMWPAAYKVGA